MSPVLISQVPAFPPSHYELTVMCLASKFEQCLIDTPNTTLSLRAAYATQNSMPQPSELPRIS
jgi:hypothetical protein